MKKIATELQKARDFLETFGWIQGAMSNAHGFCLAGAIRRVTKDDVYAKKCFSTLENFIPHNSIIRFNDDTRTKKEHVLNALDAAISLVLSNATLD